MEVMDRIRRCKDDEQLYWLTKKLIKEATKESQYRNPYRGLIGAKLNVNPDNYDLCTNRNYQIKYSVDLWEGYVPIGTKIVYGSIYNKEYNTLSNGGFYYYVDDDKYVYDFIKYIKDYEIEDIFDLVSAINGFTIKYFSKEIDASSRMNLHKLLFKNGYMFYEPQKEHSIKDFYGNGSAQCTEYALVANNLLSLFDIQILYLNDKKHAYNILINQNEQDNTYDSYILDYSYCVFVYDEQYRCIGRFPFFKKIENGTREYLEKVVNEGERIQLEDFYIFQLNGNMFECKTGKVRDYGLEYDPIEEKKLILNKKEKGKLVL